MADVAAGAASTGSNAQTANGRLYEIAFGRYRAVVAGVAATLLSWQADGEERLLTHPADEPGDSYQGKTILPWPNRIDHGQYTFDGVEHQTPITEPPRDAALHGLMNWIEWTPVRHDADRVVLTHLLHPHYGYPFQLEFEIEFAVDDQGLRTTLSARNVGPTRAPFGTAYHPYLQLGTPTVDDVVLTLPANTYYQTDERLIPTGKASVSGTRYDFREGRRLAGTELDTAFTDLTRDGEGRSVTRLSAKDCPTVELWADRTHGYLQVYTDDGAPRGRTARAGITVEPMTCAPNAFNTGDGLIVLAPGGTYQGSWGLRVAEPS